MFKVTTLLVNPEFETIRDDIYQLQGPNPNLPYKALPRRMVIDMVKFIVLWLNDLPADGGVPITITPMVTISGAALYFQRH